ncbi:MAG: N-acetylmuramoyl-L-alanine amidase [Clostridiales bacterium]|nr:N-acetylmuramoyl-L-alanine amidase [Clostridiales bacterium]
MLINIDAGHGSNTAGKRTPPMPRDIDIDGDGKVDIKKGEQYREHYANVGVAVLLVEELKRCGFKTMQTGFNDANAYDDQDQPLDERQKEIAKAKCDYSISIHFNAYGDGVAFNSAEGVEINIHETHPKESKKLAETVLKHLVKGTPQTNRGVKARSLAIVNCEKLKVKGAILVELAFMTNLREATEMMANREYWKESAKEICMGICEYTGVKYIPELNYPAKSITPKSPSADIKWAQERLNRVIPNWLPKLEVDGVYGPKTRIAVLIYWDQLGWGRHMEDDGKTIGLATRQALAEEKKK